MCWSGFYPDALAPRLSGWNPDLLSCRHSDFLWRHGTSMYAKEIIMYTFCIGLIVFLLACTSQSECPAERVEGARGRIGLLRVGTLTEASAVNFFDHGMKRFTWMLTHYGLVRFDKDGNIVPALAQSWETADLKRWVFYLRRNALWHDGVEVTSGDIAYTVEFQRRHEPAWHSVYGDIVGVETPDPYTVVFEIANPDYNFLTTIAVMTPVPKHIFQHIEDPKRYNDKKALVGTGPYVLESFDPEAGRVRFTAFDGYWGGRAAVDTVEFQLFKNPETMLMAFQKGDIDLPYTYAKGVSHYYVPKLLKNPCIGIMVSRAGGLGNVLWINNSRSPLNDRNIRQALSYAVDYEELRQLFTAGYGSVPQAGFVLEGSWGYVETRKMALDAGKSRNMLEDAGFRDLDGDGLRESPDGSKLVLTLVASIDLPDQVRLAEMVKKYLADVGVGVSLRLVDSGSFGSIMDVDKTFDLALSGTTLWGMNMGAAYGSGYVDTRTYGWSMVSAPEYQALVDALKTTMNPDRRRELAARIQRYYADEMTQVPLYTLDVIQPHTRKYEGWTHSVYTGVLCPETLYALRPAGEH